MAPLCADPRQVVIALDVASRQRLLKLIDHVISVMMMQLETPSDELGAVSTDGETNSPAPESEEQHASQHKLGKQPTAKTCHQSLGIQQAALEHLEAWRDEFLPRLKEIVKVQDDAKIVAERTKRRSAMEKKRLDTAEDGEDLMSFGDVQMDKSDDLTSLQTLYPPVPTELSTLQSQDRKEALSCVLLLLLATGKYSAYSRTLLLYLASSLELPQTFVNNEEAEIASSLLESSTADKSSKETMSAEAEAAKRRNDNKFSRYWKVGLASVAGAAVIGVTGGLAAPLVAGAIGGIMGGVGLGGVASFLGIFWMNSALVGALFGAYGAKMTGEMMDSYAKEVEDFKFIPLDDQAADSKEKATQQQRRLRVTIGINGWLSSESDVTKPWRVLGPDTEVFALRYEMKSLLALGSALQDLVHSFAWRALKVEVIKRTVLATLWAALWPIQVLAAATSVDNPFGRARNRSRKAGRLLADALINRVQGERPVTLVGYSLGATAIHACLQSLAERRAFGLVASVVLIGAPAPSSPAHWRSLRCVVSGTIFNVFSENDMVLGLVYRVHSLQLGVAGLQAIEQVGGIVNVNLSDRVSGHLRYASLTGEILRQCAFVGVSAGADIEQDDVIRMKHNHAQGKLVNIDDDDDDDAAACSPSPNTKGKEDSEDKLAHSLDRLNISPAGSSPSPSAANVGSAPPSTIPRKPVPSQQPLVHQAKAAQLASQPAPSHAESSATQRPFGAKKPTRRPLTPETSDTDSSDDVEYKPIVMEDRGGDDD
ncbi:hypothetical protein CDD81_4433 [Ophiocordyceps australis]|uniref:Uncharacterized protein n=1 Tax=Ophiocordyceps australis TaxID=1399860 RepID=A0A2C5XMK7_9HYPO|nr:hypothetical protein CDD81_4433 [Ophiocordyceps australis]